MTTDLAAVVRATTVRASARDAYDRADAEWRLAVGEACGTHTLAEVAGVAGVTRARVAQVRDGRR